MVSCGGACLLKNSMSTWAFAGTAGVPFALLSCSGKLICILTCTSIMIICFSAGICILQGQRLNLVSSLFLTPARISTRTLLEWEILRIPNTYWSISSGCRLCWYCGPQMTPSTRRTRFAARGLAWLSRFGWSSLRELLGLAACLCSVTGGGVGGRRRSAQSSVEKWRLLGSLVTRFGQWWVILQSAVLTGQQNWKDMVFSAGVFDEINFAPCFWSGAPRRPVRTEKIGHVACPGVQRRDCTGDFWGTCGVSAGNTQQGLLRNAQAVTPSCWARESSRAGGC